MKLKHFYVMLFCISLFFAACGDDDPTPEACFSMSPNPVTAGSTVTFTSCATDAHHFEWDFGDSASSDLENPTHVYNNPGTYTIQQHVFNENMTKSDSTTNTLIVN